MNRRSLLTNLATGVAAIAAGYLTERQAAGKAVAPPVYVPPPTESLVPVQQAFVSVYDQIETMRSAGTLNWEPINQNIDYKRANRV